MACQYCGNSYVTDAPFCEGCGSGKTMRPGGPEQDADRVYAQLGRAILARNSEGVLEWLDGRQSRSAEDDHQRWVRRSAKAGVCLFALMLFPQIFFFMIPLALMFSIWIYLPYRGLKSLFAWIAS